MKIKAYCLLFLLFVSTNNYGMNNDVVISNQLINVTALVDFVKKHPLIFFTPISIIGIYTLYRTIYSKATIKNTDQNNQITDQNNQITDQNNQITDQNQISLIQSSPSSEEKIVSKRLLLLLQVLSLQGRLKKLLPNDSKRIILYNYMFLINNKKKYRVPHVIKYSKNNYLDLNDQFPQTLLYNILSNYCPSNNTNVDDLISQFIIDTIKKNDIKETSYSLPRLYGYSHNKQYVIDLDCYQGQPWAHVIYNMNDDKDITTLEKILETGTGNSKTERSEYTFFNKKNYLLLIYNMYDKYASIAICDLDKKTTLFNSKLTFELDYSTINIHPQDTHIFIPCKTPKAIKIFSLNSNDLNTGISLEDTKKTISLNNHEASPNQLTLNKTGTQIAVLFNNGTIIIYAFDKNDKDNMIRTIASGESTINFLHFLKFNSTGTCILGAFRGYSQDKGCAYVGRVDTNSKTVTNITLKNLNYVRDLKNQNILLRGYNPESIQIYNCSNNKLTTLSSLLSLPTGCDYEKHTVSKNGRYLAFESIGKEPKLFITDMINNKTFSSDLNQDYSPFLQFHPHSSILMRHYNDQTSLYDTQLNCIKTISNTKWNSFFSADGNSIIDFDEKKRYELYSLNASKKIKSIHKL